MSNKLVTAVIAVFLVVLAGAGMYMANVYAERNKFTPEKIFNKAFDEDVLRAENLVGTKDESTQYDVRLHFKYPHEPKPFNDSEYKKGWYMEARNYFNERYPDQKALQELDFLKFKQRQKNETTLVTNEWILYNPHTDDVYYRVFGTAR